ncbi:MAG: dockerin type I repeat-containing protein, partial [Clostridia bacterium]|nr:dockerin type I repeat-containing protein [Clostridia bacterium]
MKKIISFILTLVMIVSALCFSSSAATATRKAHGYLPGDANDDNDVSMKDVLIMRRYIAGLEETKAIDMIAADVVEDDDINAKDVLKIRRVIAGLDEISGNNEDGYYKVDTVTVGGKNITRYSVLIPSDADECMEYSSKQLTNYINSACGIKMNIVDDRDACEDYLIEYRLDSEDEYSLGDEGYRIEVGEDGNVVIYCGARRGCLYATYYLLEKFIGYRFLTDKVEYLYKANNVDLPIGFADEEIPVLVYRGLNQIGVSDDSSDLTAIKLRLNAVDARGSGKAANFKYGGGVGNLYIHGHSYEYSEAVGRQLDMANVTDLDSAEAMEI